MGHNKEEGEMKENRKKSENEGMGERRDRYKEKGIAVGVAACISTTVYPHSLTVNLNPQEGWKGGREKKGS